MIHLLRSRATKQQLEEMLEALEVYVKQNNLAMSILDPSIRDRVWLIVKDLLGGV